MLDLAVNLAGTLLANYPEFPDSWLAVQLAFVINVCQMFIYGANVFLEEFRDQRRASQSVSLSKRHSIRMTVLGLV